MTEALSKDPFDRWLTNLPAGWSLKKLGREFGVIGSGTTPPTDVPKWYGDGYPWVTTGELRENVITTTEKSITSEAAESFPTLRKYPPGTLLIAMYGATIGRLGLLGCEATTNQACCALAAPCGLEPKYVFYWLQTFREQLIRKASGGGQPNVNQDTIRNLRISSPSRAEQARIATFLDEQTARIDSLMAEKERLIASLDAATHELLHDAVTKGIRRAPLSNSGRTWIGEVPSHWASPYIRFVARLESGHTPSRQVPAYWENCTIPWFGLADVWQIRDGKAEVVSDTAERISELGLANSSARLLPAGTVILSRTASVGFSAIMGVPMATTQDFVNWVCGPKVLPEYLLYVLRSMGSEFERLKFGSTHSTIYMPDVAKFAMPLPPLEEQREIVAFARARKQRMEELREVAATAAIRLREYRSSLISAAVTGQLDIDTFKRDADLEAA